MKRLPGRGTTRAIFTSGRTPEKALRHFGIALSEAKKSAAH